MEKLVAMLLTAMEKAIQSGDWKVDGACDPDAVMRDAEEYLRSHGWVRNSIDGEWQ